MTKANGAEAPIIIKKYANRRLYDTNASAYVTLDHLSKLVRDGKDFIVQDAKTGQDLTRSVLAQIIFEQENRQDGVLPVSFLRQLIQFYGDSFQSLLPAYLELSMNSFATQQEKWREHMGRALSETASSGNFDDQIRKNMELFEETMRIFAPYSARVQPDAAGKDTPQNGDAGEKGASSANRDALAAADPIRVMQRQMAEMQRQLAMLSGITPDKTN